MCLCVHLCVGVCIWSQVPVEPRGHGFPGAFQVVVSPLTWVLGTKPRDFARAVCSLNCWAISPTPLLAIFFNKTKKYNRTIIHSHRVSRSLNMPYGPGGSSGVAFRWEMELEVRGIWMTGTSHLCSWVLVSCSHRKVPLLSQLQRKECRKTRRRNTAKYSSQHFLSNKPQAPVMRMVRAWSW